MKNQFHLFTIIILLITIGCTIKNIPTQLNSGFFEPFKVTNQKSNLVSDFRDNNVVRKCSKDKCSEY